MKVNKHLIRQIIREELENKSILDDIWIAYGRDEYDEKLFLPLHSSRVPPRPKKNFWSNIFWTKEVEYEINKGREEALNKPMGGIWACRLKDSYQWEDFVKEDYHSQMKNLKHFFLFKLKKPCRIFTVENDEDLNMACTKASKYGRRNMDFDKMVDDGFDGIYVSYITKDCRMDYGTTDFWDVPSICVWNKDCIQPIDEDKKQILFMKYRDYYKADDDITQGFGSKLDSPNYKTYKNSISDHYKSTKENQIDHDFKYFGNRNLKNNQRDIFGKRNLAIDAQGDENDMYTQMARKYKGTAKSAIQEKRKH